MSKATRTLRTARHTRTPAAGARRTGGRGRPEHAPGDIYSHGHGDGQGVRYGRGVTRSAKVANAALELSGGNAQFAVEMILEGGFPRPGGGGGGGGGGGALPLGVPRTDTGGAQARRR